jgi:prepilin-type N-terminal cleavage/methylation domain-containing protein
MKLRNGFTLIELLVVIAIIGLLSAIVLASLNTARIKARDAKRVSEMGQIQNAIELYYSTNGHYPNSSGAWTSFDSPFYKGNPIVTPNAANLGAALAPYISSSIADPKSLGGDSGYLYIGAGVNYCILIWRTPENMLNFSSSIIPTNRCTLPIDSSGNCANGGGHAIYTGVGTYANGC